MATTQDDAVTMAAQRRIAVIYNPTKISDGLLDLIGERLDHGHWADPLLLTTTEDDPGHAMTDEALDAGGDLVLAAGGDGTVRAVAAGLGGSDVPLGVIPEGTANLLARNLGIPLIEAEALGVALGDTERPLDLVRITTDDGESDRFAVMAGLGLGLDAAIMNHTDPGLKSRAGSVAYLVAAVQKLGRKPRAMRVTVDDRTVLRRRALIALDRQCGLSPRRPRDHSRRSAGRWFDRRSGGQPTTPTTLARHRRPVHHPESVDR